MVNIHVEEQQNQTCDGRILFITDETRENTVVPSLLPRHSKARGLHFWRYPEGDEDVLTVGLGAAAQLDAEQLRAAAGSAIRDARKEEWSTIVVQRPEVLDEATEVRAILEGFMLGDYRFDKYKHSSAATLPVITVYLCAGEKGKSIAAEAHALASAAIIARDLANEPPNILRPSVLAEFVQAHFAGTAATVEVWDETRLQDEQMAGLLAVGKGSVHPPRFIVIRYEGDASKDLLALVGKGITFDTGGISLKSGRDLSDMRMDMAGAAAVIGALDAIVAKQAKVNVMGILAVAENIPDAGSLLPGELINYKNGLSVQVGNTDAEGRLVLADALIYAGQMKAVKVIDIATLTGSAANALGKRYGAIFGSDDLVAKLINAGQISGDYLWHLPLVDEYESKLDSVYADLNNIGGTQAGAIIAALFLRRFVPTGVEWAHIDMAGPMEEDETKGYRLKGASGYGARLLAEYVLAESRS